MYYTEGAAPIISLIIHGENIVGRMNRYRRAPLYLYNIRSTRGKQGKAQGKGRGKVGEKGGYLERTDEERPLTM